MADVPHHHDIQDVGLSVVGEYRGLDGSVYQKVVAIGKAAQAHVACYSVGIDCGHQGRLFIAGEYSNDVLQQLGQQGCCGFEKFGPADFLINRINWASVLIRSIFRQDVVVCDLFYDCPR
ncbi:hypothetical protein Trydic_g22622 [Trypoxylus dichotomus]